MRLGHAGHTSEPSDATTSDDEGKDSSGARGRASLRRTSPPLQRNWAFEIGFALLTLCAATLILSIVGRRAGWPLGQEFGNFLLLTQIYAAHFRHHDFFPVWSSSDAYGLGTPVLLYYQKAFFYVSGFLLILFGGDLKSALVLSTAIFLVVGAYGMRLALSTITDRKLLLTTGSLGFLFTNYVFTDWLVRGDLAEFAALMIVPWLLYWCLNLLTTRRASLLIVPIMVVLVDAHNAIALISLITLFATLAVFVAFSGLSSLRKVLPRLLISLCAIALVLAPLLIAELRFGKVYDPATKVKDFNPITSEFYSFGSYFYDGSYRWFAASNPRPVTVQIDFAIWIPIALALIVGVVSWTVTRRRKSHLDLERYFDIPVVVLLSGSVAIYLFLQLGISAWVYRALPFLQVIDYPYRMLTFIIPMGVIMAVMIAESIRRKNPSTRSASLLSVLWLVALILLSPITSTSLPSFGVPLYPGQGAVETTSIFGTPRYMKYGQSLYTYEGGVLYGEYLPKVLKPDGTELNPDFGLYRELDKLHEDAQPLSSALCSVVEPQKTPFESLQIRLTVRCNRATELALPISYNAYTQIFRSEPSGALQAVPYMHVPTDPRIVIAVPSTGREVLTVHLPTFWRVVF